MFSITLSDKLNKQNSHTNKTLMSIERLADVLIASRCGTHSLGLVYEFLLKTHGNPKEARADFVNSSRGSYPRDCARKRNCGSLKNRGAGGSHQ